MADMTNLCEGIMERKEYHNEYLKKLKEVRFRVKPEIFAEYEEAASWMGYRSMRQFIMAAIREKIDRGAS